MAKPPSQGGRQGSLWGGVLSIPDWQLSMNMRRGLVLLMLVVLPTFYNFQQAWERTAKDTWLDSGPAPENFEVEPEVLSLPPTLKRIKLIRRERKQTEASIRSTQLDAHLRPHTSADSSDEVSTELSGEVSRTGGRTAAAGIAAWPWFSFWTPNGNGSQGSGLPAGNGRDGASGSDSDVITRENDAMQEGGGKEIGGRKIGGSSRQAIASVIWKVEEALSSGGGTSHEEGSAHQLLHSRDLSGIGLPEHCSAFSPDHFRHLAGLPEPQLLPAPEAPFCFLHNRKCGGSTLRRLVKESAATKQLTTYIPCFGGVACETYDLSNMTTAVGGNVSVVAGHFSWEAIGELKGGANMSCYTTLRDPIEMFASYFYQRHPLAALEGRNLSSVSPEALRRALNTIPQVRPQDEYFLQWWAELGGPANSAVKMMTAADITGHHFGANAVEYAERRKGRPLNLTEAKRNMDQCVVGLLSDWETTLRVLNHWFPWIQTSSWSENKGENRPSDEVLPEGIRAVILEYMDLDVELYEHGLKRFASEKKLVTQLHENESNGCTVL